MDPGVGIRNERRKRKKRRGEKTKRACREETPTRCSERIKKYGAEEDMNGTHVGSTATAPMYKKPPATKGITCSRRDSHQKSPTLQQLHSTHQVSGNKGGPKNSIRVLSNTSGEIHSVDVRSCARGCGFMHSDSNERSITDKNKTKISAAVV